MSRAPADPVASGPRRGVVARLWRAGLRLRYLLFQRHRHGRLVLERVAGMRFLVLPGVFNPKLFGSGELLARTLGPEVVPPGSTVLELGTGAGAAAVTAARWAERVVAVDIDPRAVRCARANALIHGVEDRVEVEEGDLFGPVGGRRFHLVLFNPPFFRGVPRGPDDRAWRSEDVFERFARRLPEHLVEGGSALLVLSSDGDGAGALEALREAGLEVRVVARRDRVSEVLAVYRVAPAPSRRPT